MPRKTKEEREESPDRAHPFGGAQPHRGLPPGGQWPQGLRDIPGLKDQFRLKVRERRSGPLRIQGLGCPGRQFQSV